MTKTVPPVDADRFEFEYAVAMKKLRDSKEEDGPGNLIEHLEDEALILRIVACAQIMVDCFDEIGDRQIDAVRLAASYPLEKGERFDRHGFLSKLGPP